MRLAAMAMEIIGIIAVVGAVAYIYWPAAAIIGGMAAIIMAQGIGPMGRRE